MRAAGDADDPIDRADQRREQDAGRQCLPAEPGTQQRQQLEVAVAHAFLAGELLEHLRDVVGDFRVAGEQAEVGVEARGARMVVAGAQMQVAAIAVILAAQQMGRRVTLYREASREATESPTAIGSSSWQSKCGASSPSSFARMRVRR